MDEDDEYGTDADFLAALVASSDSATTPASSARVQPTPQRIQQPTPQRLDPAPPTASTSAGPKVVQPTPQAIASKSAGSSILVSTRQKGNPILTNLRSFAWEYSDILADYVVGLTTCVLFLSLKYHRLHPEYIYNRIKGLQGKFNLRVLLTLVDIGNHEDSVKELSKTGLVNDVTVILCSSAADAARYIELFKSFEHAKPSVIRGSESKGYAEKMMEFITTPRSINKTDAVSLVSAFGSVKGAINARPEEIATVGGWGEKKVRQWCTVVDEPFRARKSARRAGEQNATDLLDRAIPLETIKTKDMLSDREKQNSKDSSAEPRKQFQPWDPAADDDEEEALISAAAAEEARKAKERKREQASKDTELSAGLAATLALLRKG
jgi:DNA excision repair protein ERCC-1